MNLFDTRHRFRDLSGRYDLVDDDVTDHVDWLIRQACRYLDRKSKHQKSGAVHYAQTAVDDFQVSIPYCRAVKEVWLTSTTERYQLEKKDLQWLIANYLSADTITSGTPLYWAPTLTRRIPEGVDISAFASYMTYMDTMTGVGQDYNAIVFLPPISAIQLIEVRGLYYSKDLALDADENYWSINHESLLIMAIMRELEVFNQNRSKVRGWEEDIQRDLEEINRDLVEEQIAEIDQMEN